VLSLRASSRAAPREISASTAARWSPSATFGGDIGIGFPLFAEEDLEFPDGVGSAVVASDVVADHGGGSQHGDKGDDTRENAAGRDPHSPLTTPDNIDLGIV
jgi:hypothetical protein